MIILAPHSLAHHLLEGDISNDDHDASIPCIIDSSSCGHTNSNNSTGEQQNRPCPKNMLEHIIRQDRMLLEHWHDTRLKVSIALGSICAPPLTLSSIDEGEEEPNLIFDHDHDTSTISPNRHNNDETQSSSSSSSSTSFRINLLDHIAEMAEAHAELFQTIDRILEILSSASSIQLRIGPTVTGNSGLVARAENAWIARQRHRRQQCNNMEPPKLTLQKLRNLLHRAIVDQANSLFGMLESTVAQQHQKQSQSTVEWKTFVQDLRHSLQLPGNILTLSQLSSWRNRNGEFLSAVLSNFLAEQKQHDHDACAWLLSLLSSSKLLMSDDSISRLLKSSKQFAEERAVFLHSACPLSRPNVKEFRVDAAEDGGGGGDDNGGRCLKNVTESERNSVNDEQDVVGQKNCQRIQRRRAETIIGSLQTNLEAARISLWAFGQAYSKSSAQETTFSAAAADRTASRVDGNPNVEDSESAQVWWSQFKDMMERSYSIMSEIDEYFQFPAALFDAEGEGTESNNNIGRLDESETKKTEWSVHVDDAIGKDYENLLKGTGGSGDQSNHPNAGKTLVFSGSGIKTPHQLHRQRKSKQSSSSLRGKKVSHPPTREVNIVDQLMLLQDLEKRIKTLGLIEEYEVTRVDGDPRGGDVESSLEKYREDENSSITVSANKGKSQSFSVSGSLLEELKSAIEGNVTCEDNY